MKVAVVDTNYPKEWHYGMAATEEELRVGWFERDNPNWRVRYPASPDKLRQVARIYARKVGLALPVMQDVTG